MISPAPMRPGMPGLIGAAVAISFVHTPLMFHASRVTRNATARSPRDARRSVLRGV